MTWLLVEALTGAAPELDAGALHRYLAEAVWYPTALLPEAGVKWTAVDDRTALATLAVGTTVVSLDFRFNDKGEVTGIYSAGRYGMFDGEYRRRAWEGHFTGYGEHEGMRIPTHGEVGWYADNGLELVWRGHIVDARYAFARPGAVGT